MARRRRRRCGLIAITGCMFSGKTERLIGECNTRTTYGGQKVQVFYPARDTRSNEGTITANSEASFPAQKVGSAREILKLVREDTDVVVIDEAQFFDGGLVGVCQELMKDREVFVAGLPTDFRGEPFGEVPGILAIATDMMPLKAICTVCGEDAVRTQRLIDGEPAHYDDPIILIGGKEEGYEARCLLHHVVAPPRGLKA